MIRLLRHSLLLVWLLPGVASSSSACGGYHKQTGTDESSLQRANTILVANGVDVAEKYHATRLRMYTSGGGMIWVVRLYHGLPVFLDELAFHFDSQRKLKRDRHGQPILGGEAASITHLDIDTTPKFAGEEAKKIFAERARVIHMRGKSGRSAGSISGPDYREQLNDLDTDLGIYRGDLAWRVCPHDKHYPYAYISAESGQVLFFDSGIRS